MGHPANPDRHHRKRPTETFTICDREARVDVHLPFLSMQVLLPPVLPRRSEEANRVENREGLEEDPRKEVIRGCENRKKVQNWVEFDGRVEGRRQSWLSQEETGKGSFADCRKSDSSLAEVDEAAKMGRSGVDRDSDRKVGSFGRTRTTTTTIRVDSVRGKAGGTGKKTSRKLNEGGNRKMSLVEVPTKKYAVCHRRQSLPTSDEYRRPETSTVVVDEGRGAWEAGSRYAKAGQEEGKMRTTLKDWEEPGRSAAVQGVILDTVVAWLDSVRKNRRNRKWVSSKSKPVSASKVMNQVAVEDHVLRSIDELAYLESRGREQHSGVIRRRALSCWSKR